MLVAESRSARSFTDLVRTLHNYLALMVTLVNHAQAHMLFYSGPDFVREQKRRNDDIRQRISGKLLRDLRNLHASPFRTPYRVSAR